MTSLIEYSVEGFTATVTLTNPDRRNALSLNMFRELSEVLSELEKSTEVRAVVLTGSGSAFCVGADLAAPPEQRSLQGVSIAGDISRLRASAHVAEQLYRMPQPTVAAINGACAGAGFSLAAAADFRIASDTAVFSTAFLNAGVSGDLAGIWFVDKILGGARTRELFMTPDKFDADRALEIGLVTGVAPATMLAEAARELADRLANSAPVAMRAMKQNVIQAQTSSLGDYIDAEVERMVRSFHTADAKEATAAFLEKRPPVFEGR
ncbi:enoyl-CoA hydratase/isomerase family protein [Antrihabitans cavernicola]|uniref:Enoyl-CoA hydratase n=1 Tax=Antrihabitans cavernicola TaxID=2495913 RepID=A0A5A7SGZ4_9NOCA|nr:enoyl-CoA hydratase-related protein [Spelaeibacter cavernicola]KAA0024894.1 enoyl-CoA hydratase [Spelaeibacter cavernicola]